MEEVQATFEKKSDVSKKKIINNLLYEVVPKCNLSDLILPENVWTDINEFIFEQLNCKTLRSYGAEPQNKIFLYGKPGMGQGLIVDAIAYKLQLPMFVVINESLLFCNDEELNRRLDEIINYVSKGHCMLYFDRLETTQISPKKFRKLNFLIFNKIKTIPSFVVCAFNVNDRGWSEFFHATSNYSINLLMESAVSSFQTILYLLSPNRDQTAEIIRKFEDRTGIRLPITADDLAKEISFISFSEVNDFCWYFWKHYLLSDKSTGSLEYILNRAIAKKSPKDPLGYHAMRKRIYERSTK